MLGVLTGCGVIGIVVLIGYVLGRTGAAGPTAGSVLNRVAFFVGTPALTFTVLSTADLHIVLSSYMLVALSCTVLCALIYVVVSRIFFPTPLAETTIGAAASIYLNSNNMGLPVAVYVLGDPTAVAAVLVLQPLLVSPAVLSLLDFGTRGKPSLRSVLLQPLRNPIIPAAALGLIVALSGWTVPDVIAKPIDLLAGAAIPVVLLAFGMSLNGQRPFLAGSGRKQTLVASLIKSVVMPGIAFLLGHFVLRMEPSQVFAVVIVAALPTGQIVYNYAARYGRAVLPARDTTVLTTILAVPVMLVAALLLT